MRDARSPPGALVCPRGLGSDRGGRGRHLTPGGLGQAADLRARRRVGADRRSLRGPDARRVEVVATHPAFVLGMVDLGPAPMLVIGQLVIFATERRPGLGWSATPLSTRLPRRRRAAGAPGPRHLGIVTDVGLVLARRRRPLRRYVGAQLMLVRCTCAYSRASGSSARWPTPGAPAVGEPRARVCDRRPRLPGGDRRRRGDRALGRHPRWPTRACSATCSRPSATPRRRASSRPTPRSSATASCASSSTSSTPAIR